MATAEERDLAIEQLRERLHPGDTIWTTVTHVARSGMSRCIVPIIIRDNEPEALTWLVVRAGIGKRHKRHEGVTMSGCGMDMGFELVYVLSCLLFPDGFDCIGNNCRSNDHTNGDQNYSPLHHHDDGGYALRQRWL